MESRQFTGERCARDVIGFDRQFRRGRLSQTAPNGPAVTATPTA